MRVAGRSPARARILRAFMNNHPIRRPPVVGRTLSTVRPALPAATAARPLLQPSSSTVWAEEPGDLGTERRRGDVMRLARQRAELRVR